MAAVTAVRARVPRLAIVVHRSFELAGRETLRFGRHPMQLLNRKRHGLIDQQDDGQRDYKNSGESTHGAHSTVSLSEFANRRAFCEYRHP